MKPSIKNNFVLEDSWDRKATLYQTVSKAGLKCLVKTNKHFRIYNIRDISMEITMIRISRSVFFNIL